MFKLSESAVHVVGGDARATVTDLDTAFATGLRWAANSIDAIKDANVPAGQSQKLYRSFHASLGDLLNGRNGMISAITQLQVIHRNSNQAEVDAGCPVWRFFTDAELVGTETATAATLAA